jgi:hypothetical protein
MSEELKQDEQLDKHVLFFDEEGNPVTALDLVVEVQIGATRSADRKFSAKRGPYGDIASQGGFVSASQSLTAKVPPGASPNVVQQIIDELYYTCAIAVTERIEAEAAELERDLQIPEPTFEDETGDDDYPRSVEDTWSEDDPSIEEHDAPPTPPPASPQAADQAAGRVPFGPIAAERKPGQWWVERYDEYKLENLVSPKGNKYQRVTFYDSTAKFPRSVQVVPWETATGSPDDEPILPPSWLVAMAADGAHHPLKTTVYAVFVITHGRTSRGNYEKRLVRLTTVEDKAKPTEIELAL